MSAPLPMIALLAVQAPTAPQAVTIATPGPLAAIGEIAEEAPDGAARPEAAGTVSAPPPPATAEAPPIVVTGEVRPPKSDPLEHANYEAFKVTQSVDGAVVRPVAMGFKHAVPGPVRTGLRHFFRNLRAPVRALNFLLQFKPGRAAETVGRFAVNSTVGVGGLLDIARNRPFKLPYRPNGFADTLGYYGVKPGAYLFLPLVGPTTLRDLVGGVADGMVLPLAVGKPFSSPAYSIPSGTFRMLDRRVELEQQLQEFRESDNPYAVEREFYLTRRQAEIDALHGKQPAAAAGTAGPAANPD